MFSTITIVGVGLIGGSVGLAAKKRRLVERVHGLGRNADSLERARQCGAIDAAFLDPSAAVADANLVVLCTPVDQIARQALDYGPRCRPGTLLTDAGSTKGTIVSAIEGKLPAGIQFVGSHPLAGSEKRGPDFADADLFQNRWTIVTRTERTDAAALEKICAFWQGLGARVRVMDPAEHDRALALTSHVPHLLAAALAGTLPPEYRELAATGFRDTTRIAAGDPALWTAIFQHNRDGVLAQLALVEENLACYRQALARQDWAAVETLLAQAKKVRDALGS